MKKNNELRVIKKYQNRRLYDTATSTYIILEDIKQIITNGEALKVIDAKTNEDVTRSVLLQIILDEENNSAPIFSHEFLLQIIRFYGKAFQPAISPFLEHSMSILKQTQKQFIKQSREINRADGLNGWLDKWEDFWATNNQSIQQNILDYLTNTTNNFLKMQLGVQEQFQNQRDNLINMLNFHFATTKKLH